MCIDNGLGVQQAEETFYVWRVFRIIKSWRFLSSGDKLPAGLYPLYRDLRGSSHFGKLSEETRIETDIVYFAEDSFDRGFGFCCFRTRDLARQYKKDLSWRFKKPLTIRKVRIPAGTLFEKGFIQWDCPMAYAPAIRVSQMEVIGNSRG